MYEKRKRLNREFYTVDALTLSKELLGKVLVHETSLGTVRGVITETEAYMGVDDKGSHTYQGKRTNRTEPMFHIGGTSYVYLIYGMYACVNITAGEAEIPMASLIRMVYPYDEESKEIMEQLRLRNQMAKHERKLVRNGVTEKNQDKQIHMEKQLKEIRKHLADGPGKLCVAMELSKEDNDIDLVTDDHLYIEEGIVYQPERMVVGKRIGIDYAEEAADYLWRFTLR